jgi:hypothetical protein
MTAVNFRELQSRLEAGQVSAEEARRLEPVVRELMMSDPTQGWVALYKLLDKVIAEAWRESR